MSQGGPVKCVGCGKAQPESESVYTLIGGKSGWRVTRQKEASGLITTQWRCPDCWAAFRKTSRAPGGS